VGYLGNQGVRQAHLSRETWLWHFLTEEKIQHTRPCARRTIFAGLSLSKEIQNWGVSGGSGFALALTHIASKSECLGTLLMALSAPIEASRTGQSISRFFFEMLCILLPQAAEASQRRRMNKYLEYIATFESMPASELRKTENGRKLLVDRERYSAITGDTYDYAAGDRYWGFELEEVDANRILIHVLESAFIGKLHVTIVSLKSHPPCQFVLLCFLHINSRMV
jgi:hypothetical protein